MSHTVNNSFSKITFLFRFCILIGLVIFVSSCNITKFLSEDELIVDDVDLFIVGEKKGLNAVELKDELEKFYRIKPNNNRKSYNYYRYKDLENPPWIKRWRKNKRSEKPSLVDSTLIEETSFAIGNYLRNKKGYYDATVEYKVINNPPSKRAQIKYLIEAGPRYTINTVHHISKDSSLVEKLKQISTNSLLNSGDPIDALTFDLEKQRIVSEFQQQGYADFNLTNVEIKGDSTELQKSWDIFMMVVPPGDQTIHKGFRVGDINIYTDSHQNQSESSLDTEFRFNKNYKKESSDFIVRPSTIDRKIYLKKFEVYNSELFDKTRRSLYSLSTYRFAKITPEVNEQDSSLIDYDIFLTPHSQKFVLDFGIEAFYSNISIRNANLVGIALNGGLENRNAFGGSEIFKTSIETGVEFDPSVPEVVTLSLGWNNNVEIPTLTKPFNVLRPLNRLHIIKDKSMSVLQDEGKSNISLGFNYIDNLNFYKIFSIKAGYGYDFVLNNKNRISFNQIGVNFTLNNVPDGSPFEDILNRNPVLKRSFESTLFTGFLFKDLTYYYHTKRGKYKSNFAFISQLELSGIEVGLINSISNALTKKNVEWNIGGIEFERLAKIEFDLRWYQKPRRKSQLAARLRTGIAIPLDADPTVSYIKQYSVGGPSSIRAWRPMHLGPGEYFDDALFPSVPKDSRDDIVLYQRGDILLDMSLEYRFDLLWVVEGALFADAGNIWTLREDSLRPGAKFGFDFLSTLAVGYGYGIRFDFNYFIIRFDLGFKLKYPAIVDPFDGLPRLSSEWTGPSGQKFGNFNIAVNYPF